MGGRYGPYSGLWTLDFDGCVQGTETTTSLAALMPALMPARLLCFDAHNQYVQGTYLHTYLMLAR